ncbi:MAG: T9SS type A sorting domain-containing protein, partial [Bacteroidetes bacterium]|nr:T9SS type A sorting domain-containing protein [Bacteroidota bacterium]
KKLVEVDGAPYDAGALPCFGADGADRLLVSFTLSNQGSSVAENVLLRIQPGPRFAADEDALPPGVSVASGAVEAVCPTILPGETRRLLLPFRAADDACARVYDSTDVVASMTATYDGGYALSGKLVKDRFTVPDERAIDLPAHDFAIRRLLTSRSEVCPGGTVTLYLEVENGPVAATAVTAAYYGIINGTDTLLLAEQQIDALAAFSTAVLSATVDVPEEAQRFEYFVQLDPDAAYDEFCESNNVGGMQLPVAGREWILDVASHPNPMHNETTIRYTLPRETRGLTLAVYDLDGREVGRVASPPGGIGANSVVWRNGTLPAGTYFYTFHGTDADGEDVRFTGRVVKL